MKKLYFKALIFVLTLAILFSCAGVGASAENTEQAAVDSEIVIPDAEIQTVITENSYLSYLEANKNVGFASQSVKTQLGATVSPDAASCQIDVPNDGLYNIGMSYKAADNANGVLEFGVMIDGAYPFDEAKKLYLSRIYVPEQYPFLASKGLIFS